MRIALAPMEGITNVIFRRVYLKHFGGVDVSYTPFITANRTHSFKKKEKMEMIPFDPYTVPQILSNDAEAFIWAAGQMKELGYREVDLNLGCPSPTVTTRGRGAGMLSDLEKLKDFFDRLFDADDMPGISVKTRVGIDDPAEAGAIAELYSGYPFTKVIVHPRLLKDLYKGKPRNECFKCFYDLIPAEKLVYNGDINTSEAAEAVVKAFPGVEEIMIGRGLLSDPFLPEEIKGIKTSGAGRIPAFLEELWDEYSGQQYADRDCLYKMKEIWSYLYRYYPQGERILKEVRKAEDASRYRQIIKTNCK